MRLFFVIMVLVVLNSCDSNGSSANIQTNSQNADTAASPNNSDNIQTFPEISSKESQDNNNFGEATFGSATFE